MCCILHLSVQRRKVRVYFKFNLLSEFFTVFSMCVYAAHICVCLCVCLCVWFCWVGGGGPVARMKMKQAACNLFFNLYWDAQSISLNIVKSNKHLKPATIHFTATELAVTVTF